MFYLTGAVKNYDWGSTSAIPTLCHFLADGTPVAEFWFGEHPLGCASVSADAAASLGIRGVQPRGREQVSLHELISAAPRQLLGLDVIDSFGAQLPFLVKFIAPVKPLSLQVHPNRQQAATGFAREESLGIARDAPNRNYRDANHKPEMVYAIREFFALSGFRTARRARQILAGLETELTRQLRLDLALGFGSNAMERAVRRIMALDEDAAAAASAEVAAACQARLDAGTSPSLRADRVAVRIAEEHPGDPAVALALLLNPVSLAPGEVLYTPAGTPHAYISGVGLEVMAASDNVLRLGATSKHIDRDEALRLIDFRAAPPSRVAGESNPGGVRMFYAPIDDFELGVAQVNRRITWPRGGPRLAVCLDGVVTAHCLASDDPAAPNELQLVRGQAAFISAADGALQLTGDGRIAIVSVP